MRNLHSSFSDGSEKTRSRLYAKLHTANERSLIDAENECKFLMKNSGIGSLSKITCSLVAPE